MLREAFETSPHDLMAAIASNLRALEADAASPMAARVQTLLDDSHALFLETAQPRGLIQSVSLPQFEDIYIGEGTNDSDTPLEHVIEEAESLALFAATLGEAVSRRIVDFFADGNPADGYILDQICSYAADELAQIAAHRFVKDQTTGPDSAVLPYSPGYCGWNVSGQRALFAHLEPGELGITLNESCLMSPVKSVSGVLVLAPIEAHDFSPAFPCCTTCAMLNCQERIAELRSR